MYKHRVFFPDGGHAPLLRLLLPSSASALRGGSAGVLSRACRTRAAQPSSREDLILTPNFFVNP